MEVSLARIIHKLGQPEVMGRERGFLREKFGEGDSCFG
jgi:hypothetical protein